MSPASADSDPIDLVVLHATSFPAIDESRLSEWLRELLAALDPNHSSLGVSFVDDDEMRRLNHGYRLRASTTDVLSFPGEDGPDGPHLGDIVISVPTAERQAAESQESLDAELRRLLLHGVLHCQGYDHETDSGEMEEREAELRRRWIS